MKKDLIEFYLMVFALLAPPIITICISSIFDIKETLTQANIMGMFYVVILPPIVHKVVYKPKER